jgi:hypothetical protein
MAKQRVEDTYSNASTALSIVKDIAKDKVESAYKNATFVLEHRIVINHDLLNVYLLLPQVPHQH